MLKLLTLFYLLFIYYPAHADYPPADVALLPPYCKARLHGGKPGEYELWGKKLGPGNFTWMNHYCGALVDITHCPYDEKRRKACLKKILPKYDYTFENTSESFAIRPIVHYDKGMLLLELKDNAAAEQEFFNAIKLKPDAALPYIALYKLYLKQEKKDEALKIIRSGLEHNPHSKTLKKYLSELSNR